MYLFAYMNYATSVYRTFFKVKGAYNLKSKICFVRARVHVYVCVCVCVYAYSAMTGLVRLDMAKKKIAVTTFFRLFTHFDEGHLHAI